MRGVIDVAKAFGMEPPKVVELEFDSSKLVTMFTAVNQAVKTVQDDPTSLVLVKAGQDGQVTAITRNQDLAEAYKMG